jgi:hypothetical protein
MTNQATAQMDRRRYPRINANFSMEVTPSPTGEGTGINVSQGGLQFSHRGKLNPGSLLNMILRVHGFSGTVHVKGKVIRCEESGTDNYYHVSINFVDTDHETEASIIDMIKSFQS